MVDAFLLSEMIFMPVPFQLLKCDDDETAQQALVRQVTPNEILLPVDKKLSRGPDPERVQDSR